MKAHIYVHDKVAEAIPHQGRPGRRLTPVLCEVVEGLQDTDAYRKQSVGADIAVLAGAQEDGYIVVGDTSSRGVIPYVHGTLFGYGPDCAGFKDAMSKEFRAERLLVLAATEAIADMVQPALAEVGYQVQRVR